MIKSKVGIGNSEDIKIAVNDAIKNFDNPTSIFIFSEVNKFKDTVKYVNEIYPKITVIGTTGYSIIGKNTLKNSVVLLAIEDGLEIKAAVLEEIDKYPVKYINRLEKDVDNIKSDHNNTVCLEFCTGYEEMIVSTINSAIKKSNIPLIGGTSQGIDKEGKKYVSLNGKVYSDACVYALIKNINGKIKVYKENIFKNISNNMIATKVNTKERIILEINGMNAGQVYCENLNINKNEISKKALTNPMGRIVGNDTFITAIKSVMKDNSLQCYKKINQNDVLNILELDNYKEIIRNTIENINKEFKSISLMLSINCILRFLLFESENYIDEYANLMSSIGLHVGLVSEGEQYINQHINQTMICVVFE